MAFFDCHFFSESLGVSCSIYVILPQKTLNQAGMPSASYDTKHPTLYLLHGLSNDHTIWLWRTSIERYAAQQGLAVVMPAVNRSFYTDMPNGQRYWEYVSEELPRLARSFFPLSDRREDNFVAGLSMGGYGALKLALTFPERYAAVASLSGLTDICWPIEKRTSEFLPVLGDVSSALGTDKDVFHLARKLAESDREKPRLYQCCGTEDFLYPDNVRFRDHCREVGLELTYEEEPGVHDWDYWDKKIERVLEWLPIGEGNPTSPASTGR